MFACVQAAMLLTLTTTVAQLLDTFTVIVSPLRFFGASPDTIALTASLMVRAISHISGLLGGRPCRSSTWSRLQHQG